MVCSGRTWKELKPLTAERSVAAQLLADLGELAMQRLFVDVAIADLFLSNFRGMPTAIAEGQIASEGRHRKGLQLDASFDTVQERPPGSPPAFARRACRVFF